jgi:hypothetical protein
MSTQTSPSSLSSPPGTPTASDDSTHTSPSLFECLEKMTQSPTCISNDWIDTLADFKTNPRVMSTPPYNDGALYWVNNNNQVLSLVFPAVLDLHGKYSRLGPYFSLVGEKVNNHFLCSITELTFILETHHPYFK